MGLVGVLAALLCVVNDVNAAFGDRQGELSVLAAIAPCDDAGTPAVNPLGDFLAASPEELKALVKAQQDTRSSKGKTQATANASTAADGAGAGWGRGQSLRKWLDSVNLGRLYNVLVHLGATDPSDLADMDEEDVRELKLRTLEQPRWERALRTLRGLAGREKLPAAARQASSSHSTAGAVSAPKDTTRSGSSAVSAPSRPTTGKTQPAVPTLPVPTDKPFLCVVTRVRCVRHSLASLL